MFSSIRFPLIRMYGSASVQPVSTIQMSICRYHAVAWMKMESTHTSSLIICVQYWSQVTPLAIATLASYSVLNLAIIGNFDFSMNCCTELLSIECPVLFLYDFYYLFCCYYHLVIHLFSFILFIFGWWGVSYFFVLYQILSVSVPWKGIYIGDGYCCYRGNKVNST